MQRKHPDQDNPAESVGSMKRAFDKIEYNRKHGKPMEGRFFFINPEESKAALSKALAMDREKALARKRFRVDSVLKTKRAQSTLAASRSKGFK